MRSDETGSDVAKVRRDALSVVLLIQRQAQARPEALAVRSAREAISYRELETRSNQLANYFRSLGIAAGNIVGLCLNRSINFPISAFALLKIGAAYLPLEPKTPPKRLQTMLKSAEVRFVLTDSGTTQSVPSGNWKTLDLDASAEVIHQCSSEFLAPPVGARQAA